MNRAANVLFSCISLLLPCSSGWCASFQGLGCSPCFLRDVSADGSVVVGTQGGRGFRWTPAEGLVIIPDLPGGTAVSDANGVSSDGGYVVGGSIGNEAYRWNAVDGAVGLGGTSASDVSDDGSVVVGWARDGQRPMMWTEQTGIQLLADVEGEALGVSGDGSTVVGAASGHAFRWTKQDGLQLMDLGYAFAASFDGSVIVGRRWDGQVLRWQAFRWSEETGTMPVGDLPGGSVLSAAHDVSADGSVVVGWSAAKNDETAFIWDELHGMRDLHNVLIEQGVNLAGWHLSSVEAVSGDGLTLVGYGTNPAGNYEPWIAVVPEPGSRSLILPGMLVVIGGLRHWPRRRLCLR